MSAQPLVSTFYSIFYDAKAGVWFAEIAAPFRRFGIPSLGAGDSPEAALKDLIDKHSAAGAEPINSTED